MMLADTTTALTVTGTSLPLLAARVMLLVFVIAYPVYNVFKAIDVQQKHGTKR